MQYCLQNCFANARRLGLLVASMSSAGYADASQVGSVRHAAGMSRSAQMPQSRFPSNWKNQPVMISTAT